MLTVMFFGALLAVQSAPAIDQSVTQVDDVAVHAEASRNAARAQIERFVDTATRSPRGRPLARWTDPVCISAVNFQPAFGRAIIERVSRRMLEAGLNVEEEGCKPDLMIIGADDGKALAQTLVADAEQGFRPSRGNTDLGSRALKEFQQSDRPIRWWHVSLPVSAETGEVAIRLDGDSEPSFLNVREASRLRSNIRDKLARVVVIIEPAKLSGVRGTALADYVAFLSMAQVDPSTDMTGFDTILNLLASPQDYAELTEWDQDFLAGLYATNPPRFGTQQQQRDIANAVLRRRDREGQAAEAVQTND